MAQELIVQGRIVWGHPSKLTQKVDRTTRQKVFKDGQPVMQCSFGLAIEKNMFFQQVLPHFQAEARTAFPNGTPPKFSWKYKDGDTDIDEKGRPYNQREGYAGHCVLTISTQGFAPQVFKNENGAYRQLAENEIKCGDFAAVSIAVKYNNAATGLTPGVYVNPNAVILTGYGPEIASSGQDPDELFAGFVPQLPPGASSTPLLGNAPLPTAMHPGQAPAPVASPQYGQPQQGYAPAAAVQPQPHIPQHYAPAPVAAPQPLPAPAHDFVNNAIGGQPNPPQYAQPVQNQPPQMNYAPGAVNANVAAPYPSNVPAQGYAPAPVAAPQYGQPGGVMPGMPNPR